MALALAAPTPAVLRFRAGEVVVIAATDTCSEDISIHWHGLILPFEQDGVPGISHAGGMSGPPPRPRGDAGDLAALRLALGSRTRRRARLQVPVLDVFDAVGGDDLDPRRPGLGPRGARAHRPRAAVVRGRPRGADPQPPGPDAERRGLGPPPSTTRPSGRGPEVEIGARLSYDVADRLFAPHAGVHSERVFGESADLAQAAGAPRDGLFVVAGARILFRSLRNRRVPALFSPGRTPPLTFP